MSRGKERGKMNRIFQTGAILAAATAIGVAGLTSGVQAQANCEVYSKLALKQARANETKKCGLTGPRWSTDVKAHATWCSTVGPTEWRSELKKRSAELKKCG